MPVEAFLTVNCVVTVPW